MTAKNIFLLYVRRKSCVFFIPSRRIHAGGVSVMAAAWTVKAAMLICRLTSCHAFFGSAEFWMSNKASQIPGKDSPAYLLWLLGAKITCLEQKGVGREKGLLNSYFIHWSMGAVVEHTICCLRKMQTCFYILMDKIQNLYVNILILSFYMTRITPHFK